MKILLVGSSEIWSIENYYVKHLSTIEDVHLTLYSSSRLLKKMNIFKRIERRIFPNNNSIYRTFNRELIEFVDSSAPEIILIFKGMEIFPSTLSKFKEKGILLANFNGDHPFIISSRGTGNRNVRSSIGLYQMHFSYSQLVVEKISKELGLPAVHLPFGFELNDDIYNSFEEEEINRIAFIGNPDKTRLKYIQALLKANLAVDIYGHGWNRYFRQKSTHNLRLFDAVYGNDFWHTARKYRVQLNIFRPHNVGSHNMRTFEMPAIGAIMLAPDSNEHRKFFNVDDEVFLYSNEEEMINKARFLLNISRESASKIREKARVRSIQSGYTYQDRSYEIYYNLKKMLS